MTDSETLQTENQTKEEQDKSVARITYIHKVIQSVYEDRLKELELRVQALETLNEGFRKS